MRRRHGEGDRSAELLAEAGTLAPELEAKIRLELELRSLARGIEAGRGAPRVLGRFQALDRLGQGGISRVYRAHDPGLGRRIALEVLAQEALLDRDQRGWILKAAPQR